VCAQTNNAVTVCIIPPIKVISRTQVEFFFYKFFELEMKNLMPGPSSSASSAGLDVGSDWHIASVESPQSDLSSFNKYPPIAASSSISGVTDDENPTLKKSLSFESGWVWLNPSSPLWTNISFATFCMFIVSLTFGVCFYSVFHGWDVSTAFYYSSQVLLGNMYNIPLELDIYSEAFTMIFFLWGTGLVACCHIIATNYANSQVVENSSGKISGELAAPEWAVNTLRSVGLLRLLRHRGPSFRIRIFCISLAAVWIFLGTLYGVYVEEWSFLHAIYFAVGAMSAAGVPSPPCVNGDDLYPDASCQLGTLRGFALGIYLIVGVPLFAFTVGLLAGYVVDYYAVLDHKRIKSSSHLPKLGLPPSPRVEPRNNILSSTGKASNSSICWCTRNRTASSETESDFILGELIRRGRICGSEVTEIRKSLCGRMCSCCITVRGSNRDSAREPELVEISTRRWFQYKRFVVPLICSIILLCLYVYVNSLPEMQTAANLELDALVGAALTNSSASPLVQSGEVAEADNILSPKDSLIIDNIVA
jgi:hypothetical protein